MVLDDGTPLVCNQEEEAAAPRATATGRRLAVCFAVSAALLLAGTAIFRCVPEGLRGPPPSERASVVSLTAAGRCQGFEKCPEYPMPYKQQEWPTEYSYMGKFPDGFVWGLGTAAYQIEGGYRDGGRGASIWDTFSGADTVGMPGGVCSYCCKVAPCPVHPGMFSKGATGNVACDHYNVWMSDVALMKSMGLKNYRFSVAWPRVIPTGNLADGVNEEGIKFYDTLIDALIAAGITPYVTLYHWDLPQGLMDPPRVSGWWSRDADGQPNGQILPQWLDYADLCFKRFGDRVKVWITFNEAFTFTFFGSGLGKAPSHPKYSDLDVDPYVAGHNVLNAHAAAVDLYRRKYQATQGGKIGITNNCDWHEPKTSKPEDIAAAERTTLFQLGWFADPIFSGTGDYPAPMRKLFGRKLPRFTAKQRKLINNSSDFFGLNHYGTAWTSYSSESNHNSFAKFSEDGLPHAQSVWLYGAGWGFRKLLNWVNRRYHHPPIYVTEAGWSLAADTPDAGALDASRVAYYANYTTAMHGAINEDGIDIRGFFAWSFMDNYEWERGYLERFGVTFSDFSFGVDPFGPAQNFLAQPSVGQPVRRRKDSSCWLEAVWTTNKLWHPEQSTCVHPSVMNGSFRDSKYSGCERTIAFNEKIGQIRDGAGCTSEALLGSLPVAVDGAAIIMDLSSRGGPKNFGGYWSRHLRAIEWGDGSTWTKNDGKDEGGKDFSKSGNKEHDKKRQKKLEQRLHHTLAKGTGALPNGTGDLSGAGAGAPLDDAAGSSRDKNTAAGSSRDKNTGSSRCLLAGSFFLIQAVHVLGLYLLLTV